MVENKKTILITGASSGIGIETALRLAKEGHKVFAGIRKKVDKIEIEKLNKNIKGVYLDVTNQSSIDKAFWFILKNTDKIDILINNAGVVTAGPIEFIDTKSLKEQFAINTFGALAVAQKFIPLLHNGRIINISSMAATGIFPYIAPYCASKRALDILFNSFALENLDNIKVVSIKPAAIKTPIWNKSVKKAKEYYEKLNEVSQKKYEKQLKFLADNALRNNEIGIDSYIVVDAIVKAINAKNPKASYNVGTKSVWCDILSKFSQDFINRLVKLKMPKA